MSTPCVNPALILAAGLGTRCRPLSWIRAKPALPVAGEPLVRRLLRQLRARGVTEAVINLHHRPETITGIVGDGSDLDIRVRYSWEPLILGSAGGPRRALALLEAPRFLVVNGDTLCGVDLAGLMAAHARTRALVTMAVVPNPDPGRYGHVFVDEEGRVRAFERLGADGPNPSWRGLHFVGVQAVEAAAFGRLPADQPAESVGGLYPRLIAERPGAIRAFESDAVFHDLGTPADYLAASIAIAAEEGMRELPVGRRTTIDPTAALVRTAAWDDVEIGAGCQLTDCVIGDRVTLPPGTRLTRCAVVRRSDVPAGVTTAGASDLLVVPFEAGWAPDAGQEPRP